MIDIVILFDDFRVLNHIDGTKINNKGNDKDIEDSKTDKQEAYWTMSTKRCSLAQRQNSSTWGTPGKAFTTLGWDNILKAFYEKTNPQYNFLQFKNLYGQLRSGWKTWNSLIKNMGIDYDPDVGTFTLEDARWQELIKVNQSDCPFF